MRVREWEKVIKEATKGLEAETSMTKAWSRRGDDMVAAVARLERGLSLRSREEK